MTEPPNRKVYRLGELTERQFSTNVFSHHLDDFFDSFIQPEHLGRCLGHLTHMFTCERTTRSANSSIEACEVIRALGRLPVAKTESGKIKYRSCEVRCLLIDQLGRRPLEGRDFILQVTKICQCRNRIVTTLRSSFTKGPDQERSAPVNRAPISALSARASDTELPSEVPLAKPKSGKRLLLSIAL